MTLLWVSRSTESFVSCLFGLVYSKLLTILSSFSHASRFHSARPRCRLDQLGFYASPVRDATKRNAM